MIAKHVLGDRKDICIYGVNKCGLALLISWLPGGSSLPWACRTTSYGQSVDLLGAKKNVPMTTAGNRSLEVFICCGNPLILGCRKKLAKS